MVRPLTVTTSELLAENETSEVTSKSATEEAEESDPPSKVARAVAVVCWKPPGAQSTACSSESASATCTLSGNHTDTGRLATGAPPEAGDTLILVLPPLV